ncbi:lactate dehydrogenase-like 2-hydroxyacid dehydrogenase [Bradyrhizobium sp. S3.12.5]|uniref:NAD(P)-dependent oxidoreductase n=1 Tax=Bradyrhizobium sp. S3.12.5 TaxID=3156386 RepID=UPI003399982E
MGPLRQVAVGDPYIRRGLWPTAEPGLSSKVLGRRYGIYEVGRIGIAIAKRLRAFDVSISYCSRTQRGVPYSFHDTPRELAANYDVLVVTVGASDQTRNAINADVLHALAPDGFLTNLGRGAVVDEPALVEPLREGRIAGGALDVLRQRASFSQ